MLVTFIIKVTTCFVGTRSNVWYFCGLAQTHKVWHWQMLHEFFPILRSFILLTSEGVVGASSGWRHPLLLRHDRAAGGLFWCDQHQRVHCTRWWRLHPQCQEVVDIRLVDWLETNGLASLSNVLCSLGEGQASLALPVLSIWSPQWEESWDAQNCLFVWTITTTK